MSCQGNTGSKHTLSLPWFTSILPFASYIQDAARLLVRRYYGPDGKQCSVEELALQHYASAAGGGWKGLHTEGGIWSALFALLLWDVLFSDVPDVFRTAFQTAPMDLDSDAFYPARQASIDARLQQLMDGAAADIIGRVWAEHYGVWCRGIRWEAWQLDQLLEIASCIGGVGLAVVCRLLAEDHGGWTGGMPDLLLWRSDLGGGEGAQSAPAEAAGPPSNNPKDWAANSRSDGQVATSDMAACSARGYPAASKCQAKLVEVKSQNDKLSDQQRAWIHVLKSADLSVELCKVLEPKK